MSETRNNAKPKAGGEDVLTLAEAASLLRVESTALAELAAAGAVPAQKIGAEWRFLRIALLRWLHYGPRFDELIRAVPHPWPVEPTVPERMAFLLEQRFLERVEADRQPAPRPGSKQAVQRAIGVFEGDDDMEAVLARLAAMRNEPPAEDVE